MCLKIMDVTLRESTYINDITLSEQDAINIIKGLSQSNIDFIEIGYVSKYNINSNNIFKACSISTINKLGSEILNPKTKLVLMLHPSEYTNEFLKHLTNSYVGLVRLCIPDNEVYQTLPLITKLKRYNIAISANLTRISNLSLNEIIKFAHLFENAGADYMYFADSNGAMLPHQIAKLVSTIHKETNLKLGFHPHDNLRTATANTLSAIKNGINIVDVSIYGYGKNLANLPLQSFIALIKKLNIRNDICLKQIISVSEQLYNKKLYKSFKTYLLDREFNIITGYYNINFDSIKNLKENSLQNKSNIIDTLFKNLSNNTLKSKGVDLL